MGAPSHRLTDASKGQNAHFGASHLGDSLVVLLRGPVSVSLVAHHLVSAMGEVQHDRHHVIGHRIGVRAASVGQHHITVHQLRDFYCLIHARSRNLKPSEPLSGDEHISAGHAEEHVGVLNLPSLILCGVGDRKVHIRESLGQVFQEFVVHKASQHDFHVCCLLRVWTDKRKRFGHTPGQLYSRATGNREPDCLGDSNWVDSPANSLDMNSSLTKQRGHTVVKLASKSALHYPLGI